MHIISGDLWAGAEVQAYTLLKELRTDCDLHVILMNPGELADRLAALKIPVTILDETKMNAGKILLGMRKIMLVFRPDVIHTHRQKENVLGAIANMFSVRAKSVRTSHGAPEFSAKGYRRIQPLIDKFIGHHLQNGIISVSEDLTQKLNGIFPPDKIYTIMNGVDIESLRAHAFKADFRSNDPDKMHIGIIGRLEPVKRIDIFLQMAALITAQAEDNIVQFHIIGEGSQRNTLEKMSYELGLGDNVVFHGHRTDIPACVKSLDVVVMCSDHEGTPMIALETLALGVPLVAHNVGGLKHILKKYPEWRVDDHTPHGYAKVIASISEARSREIALEECYLAHHNADKTFDVYRLVLEKR